MKTPNPDNPIRNTLKHLALALTMGAAMYFGASPANATPVTSGLALWLDASDATTMTLSGTTTVSEWRDKAGSTAKMTLQAGTPTLVAAGIGGIPTVRFNNSSRMNDGVNHPAPVTIFYVSRQTGGANNRVLGATSNNWLLGYWGGKRGSACFNGDVLLNGNGASDTDPHLYAATIPGSGQNSTVWAEGVQIASNQGGTSGPNNLQLNGYQGGSELSNCEISEVLVYHRILDSNELDAVGGYLTAKYGLTTTYPTALTVALTSPQNGSDYLVGATIPATATVFAGTAPYTVDFLLDSGSGFVSQGTDTDSPYTKDLTGLAIGSYSIKAAVTDSTAAADDSPTRTFTVSNAGPTNLAAVSGNMLVNLSWNQVLGATGYKVFRSSPDNSSYGEIATGITGLTYQDIGLTNGTPYYYVVRATVGSTVSAPSNEVSSTPLAVDNSKATVVASAPFIWADGVATSTITVTLKDGGNAPVPGMTVTLASSRPSDDTVSAASGLSDGNGVVTFTVQSSVVGTSEYTATVTDLPLTLTQKATVGFLAPAIPPPVTTGLKLHLDASQLPSLSDGATVPTWLDMSGLGNHANLSAGTPIYKPGVLNGKPVIRFNDASSFTTANLSSQFPTAATVLIVTTLNSDNAYTLVKANPGVDEWWRYDGNGNSYPGVFRGNRLEAYCPMPTTGSHLFAISSSASWEMSIDGVSKGVKAGNYNSGGALVIGNGSSGGGLNGDIAEIILYDRVLTAAEADQVGAYLATKYGLTTNYGPPAVLSSTPPDGATTAVTSDLVLTFNKPITLVEGGTITIKNLTNSGDTRVLTLPDPQVTVDGAVLTINPDDDLVLNNDYAVQIDAGAITSSAGASYAGISGDTTWNFNTAGQTLTTITVASSGTPSTYGDSVTFTATVGPVPPGGPVPTGGTVQFKNDGSNLGSPVPVNGSGVATYTTKLGVVGLYEITAEYSGFLTYESSSTLAPISQEVGKAALTVTAHNKVRRLGSANPILTYGISGFKNGENAGDAGVDGTPVLSTTAGSASIAADYDITCDASAMTANGNYTFTGSKGTLTIVDVPAVFAYDGFVYAAGPVAGNTGGSGFSGAWTNKYVSSKGFSVLTDGLTFSNLAVTGGRIQGTATVGTNETSEVMRDLSASITGQIYGSFLYRNNTPPRSTTVAGLQIGAASDGLNSQTVQFYPDEWEQTVGARFEGNSVPAAPSSGALTESQTFLVLFSANLIDNTPVAFMWVLSSAQFDTFKSGGITEAELNAASVGTGSSDVWAKATVTGNDPTLDLTNNVNFFAYGGWEGDPEILASYDELRLSNSSLDEVIPLRPAFYFADWAATNAPGQTADQDYDNDGVENGIEYFMGETGSSFTAMPGLDATNKVTWKMSAAFEGTYEVQTSPDLVTWTNVDPKPTPSGGSLSYTLPTGMGKQFVRLLVTPAP